MSGKCSNVEDKGANQAVKCQEHVKFDQYPCLKSKIILSFNVFDLVGSKNNLL